MLPPYARLIVAARRAGTHPSKITLVLGSTWCDQVYEICHAGKSRVMVLAEAYRSGAYEFWWVAGVPVVAINHDQPPEVFTPLVAEIAARTAPVVVVKPEGPELLWEDAADYLWCRRFDAGGVWPAGWDAACEREYNTRLERWEREHESVR